MTVISKDNRGLRRELALAFALLAFFALHLTRPEGTFIMLAAPLGALILCWPRGRYMYRRWGLFTAGCAVLLGAYALLMRLAIGTATLSYRAPMAGDVADYFRRGAVEFGRTAMARFFDVLPVLPVLLGQLLLLDPEPAPDTLKLLRADLSPYDGAKIVIYEIVSPGIQYLAPEDFPTTSSHMGPDEMRRKKVPAEQ